MNGHHRLYGMERYLGLGFIATDLRRKDHIVVIKLLPYRRLPQNKTDHQANR